MLTEVWKPIAGHEKSYEVSNLGRIRSLDRLVYCKAGYHQRRHGRVLKTKPDRQGYPLIQLAPSQKQLPVHRLVLEAFVGPRPPEMECRHLDDHPANNALSNLTWGTRVENRADMVRNGRCANTIKTHCPKRHPYDEANTYVSPKGARFCRACNRAAQRRVAQKRRTKAGQS